MTGAGDALVDALLHGVAEARPRLRALAHWIVEASRPPRGVHLVAPDGAEFSGILLVDRNEPVMMLAVCVSRLRQHTPAARSWPLAEEPLWSRQNNEDPFP